MRRRKRYARYSRRPLPHLAPITVTDLARLGAPRAPSPWRRRRVSRFRRRPHRFQPLFG